MKNKLPLIRTSLARVAVGALLLLAGPIAQAQTTIYSDDFNRAALGGAYTISTGGGGGTAFVLGSTTLWLTNGSPAGWVSVATNIPTGALFNATPDNCAGLVAWSFNMRFGRTGNTPSGFTSGNYGVGYVLSADNADFSAAGSKGYAILFGNTSSPDTFRLVAFTNGIKADYTAAGSAAGNALIVGTGAFATTTQAQANDYYSFQVTYDPATKIWTLNGRDDGATAFADPSAGAFTTIGTFTETTPIFRANALGRTGAYWSHSTGANNTSQFDNFKLAVTGAGPAVALDNTGTPAAGIIIAASTDVPLFGFRLSPTGGSVDFTALKLTTTGTATSADLSNFRVVYDADDSGIYNAGDIVVSSSAQSLANPINFTVTGQTGLSAAHRYLVVANVAGGATAGHTFTGSIAAAADVTTSVAANGTAAGNQQTIATSLYDLTLSAVTSSESPTISSLMNDSVITTPSQGVQVWQLTLGNPAGNAGLATVSALNLTQGANNTVVTWSNAIQAAELFDGATALAAGTISATSINFSGLTLGVADNTSKTLSLRLSLKNTAGAAADNAHFQFALTNGDVTVAGNGVTTAAINSDAGQNQITVIATKLAFASVPVLVVTNTPFSAVVLAEDANGNVDLDDTTVISITKASGTGTLTGGNGYIQTLGTNRWSALVYDTADTFTIQAAGGSLATVTSATITAVLQPTLTDVLVPQYIQGIASGSSNTKRLPYAYRVTLGSLIPNATYRYYNQCAIATDAANVAGAGNCIIASPSGSFLRTSGPSLGSAGNYGSFTADASGNYTGWFLCEPTGNARFATAATPVFMRVVLNDGNGGTSAKTYLTTTSSALVLPFGTTGTDTGTGIYGNSAATDKNFVVLYDNVAGTGRPLAATFVESDGVTENAAAASYVAFYGTSVDGISGAWGSLIPNNNANGVRRIEQRKLSDGSLVLANTDSDGVWPSGANTVNPAGGDATPIVITATDAPLGNTTPTTPVITKIQVTGGNVLIDFTGGASDGIGDFTVVGANSLAVALAPVPATITTSGPGLFRATIPVASPAAFYRIKR